MAFFAEMAWKSALIAGVALALTAMLRSRAAADRTLVLRIGVLMLLAMPFIAMWSPALEIAAFAADPARGAGAPADMALLLAMAAALPPAETTIWDDPTPLILLAWLGGLVMIGGRLAAGLWTLHRWTRQARPVECPEWLAAFEQVRWTAPRGERLRLLVSDEVPAPLSWGWLRPAILVDADTFDQPGEAEAILAHEIAHIARSDWPALIASRAAAALFWFNPLVWLLEREIVQQAEEAADAEAVDRVEPARYARTLLSCAQASGSVPANGIAPSARALARRVRAILDRSTPERPSGSAWTAAAILACIGVAAPVAAVELVQARAPQPPAAPAPAAAPSAPVPAVAAMAAAPEAPVMEGDEIVAVAPIVDEALNDVLPRIPEIVAAAMAQVDSEEIARTVERSLEAARARGHHISEAEIARAVAEARAEVARIDHAEIARAVAEARAELSRVDRAEIARAMAEARRAAPRARAHGAAGMMHGAEGMERGARQMERQAARFRDPAERRRIIAEAAAEGRTVTDEQLLEAAEDMIEGAREMREGAEEMRASARAMSEGRH